MRLAAARKLIGFGGVYMHQKRVYMYNKGVYVYKKGVYVYHIPFLLPRTRCIYFGLQLGKGEKKFGRGEASAYARFTPNELIAYAERIRFTPNAAELFFTPAELWAPYT